MKLFLGLALVAGLGASSAEPSPAVAPGTPPPFSEFSDDTFDGMEEVKMENPNMAQDLRGLSRRPVGKENIPNDQYDMTRCLGWRCFERSHKFPPYECFEDSRVKLAPVSMEQTRSDNDRKRCVNKACNWVQFGRTYECKHDSTGDPRENSKPRAHETPYNYEAHTENDEDASSMMRCLGWECKENTRNFYGFACTADPDVHQAPGDQSRFQRGGRKRCVDKKCHWLEYGKTYNCIHHPHHQTKQDILNNDQDDMSICLGWRCYNRSFVPFYQCYPDSKVQKAPESYDQAVSESSRNRKKCVNKKCKWIKFGKAYECHNDSTGDPTERKQGFKEGVQGFFNNVFKTV